MRLTDEIKKASKEAWTMLTPSQKKAWRLCRKMGFSTKSAGDRLGVSQQAIQSRLELAEKKFVFQLQKIREEMEKNNGY